MIIYSFDTESDAYAGAKRRHINYIKDMFAQGKPIRNGGEFIITSLDGMTDEQISQLKVCALREDHVELATGLTTSFVTVIKAYDHEKWYFPKANGEYMTGVVNYTEMTLPEDWKPPALLS